MLSQNNSQFLLLRLPTYSLTSLRLVSEPSRCSLRRLHMLLVLAGRRNLDVLEQLPGLFLHLSLYRLQCISSPPHL